MWVLAGVGRPHVSQHNRLRRPAHAASIRQHCEAVLVPGCWHSQGKTFMVGVPASSKSCHLLFFVNSELRSFQQLHLLQCFQLAMLPGQGGSTSAPAVV